MRRGIDFKALKRMVTYRAILELLGWRHRRHEGKWYRGSCPLKSHLPKHDREFGVAPEGWYCLTCREGGDQLDLWRQVTSFDLYHAALDLCKRLALDVPYLPRRPRKPRPPRPEKRRSVRGAAGVSPASSPVPPCGPAHDAQQARGGPTRGPGGLEIGPPERS